MYSFTQHSEVLARLREEIATCCPGNAAPTYENLRSMKYCKYISNLCSCPHLIIARLVRAVLNEALRLWPPVPGNGRATLSEPCLIPPSQFTDFGSAKNAQPLYIPGGGGFVDYLTLNIQRRKDLWGDDADLFDPDRWLDGRLDKMVKNPFMFVPFHAGPRIVCLALPVHVPMSGTDDGAVSRTTVRPKRSLILPRSAASAVRKF